MLTPANNPPCYATTLYDGIRYNSEYKKVTVIIDGSQKIEKVTDDVLAACQKVLDAKPMYARHYD